MFRTLLKIKTKKVAFLVGLVVAVIGVVSSTGLAVHKVSAADCDNNAIIYCGFTSPGQFIQRVRDNHSNNGHQDLQAVYSHYGLTSADYTNFANNAVHGWAYSDGRMTLDDGTVVATDGKSIGRDASYQGADHFNVPIGGNTYYGNVNQKTFRTGTGRIGTYMLLDKFGNLQFAVMQSCGNPAFGNNKPTSASCGGLQASSVAGQPDQYNFSASTNLQGNAKAVKYVYTFDDGSTQTVTSNFGQTVKHTYSHGGTYRVSVTQYVSVPGDNSVRLEVTSTCIKTITVTLPAYSCMQTTAALADNSNQYRYVFKTATSVKNGADLKKVVYVINGTKQTSTAADGSLAYTFPGKTAQVKYAVTATAYFSVPGMNGLQPSSGGGCEKTVTVTPPLFECAGLSGSHKFLDYTFVATAKYGPGVKPVAATITYGDGTTGNGTLNGSKFTFTHSYKAANTYYQAAQLYFNVPGVGTKVAANYKCTASAKPNQPPVSTCKPGTDIPVGDARCNPCPTNPAVPADDTADCTPVQPPDLPNTGAGNTIAIFAAVVIGGFLIYRQLLFRNHKAAFAAAQYGTSPLPLADPLNDEAPLAGTPLAPKRRSFRKRQF